MKICESFVLSVSLWSQLVGRITINRGCEWDLPSSDKGRKILILLKTDEKRKKLPTTDRKNINRLPSNGPTLSIFVFIRKRFCIFSSLGSNHIKFTTCQMVQRKELPPLLIRLYSNRQPTSGLRMVADNCHSSKRHKFVNFRLNFNYFELKMKWK